MLRYGIRIDVGAESIDIRPGLTDIAGCSPIIDRGVLAYWPGRGRGIDPSGELRERAFFDREAGIAAGAGQGTPFRAGGGGVRGDPADDVDQPQATRGDPRRDVGA